MLGTAARLVDARCHHISEMKTEELLTSFRVSRIKSDIDQCSGARNIRCLMTKTDKIGDGRCEIATNSQGLSLRDQDSLHIGLHLLTWWFLLMFWWSPYITHMDHLWSTGHAQIGLHITRYSLFSNTQNHLFVSNYHYVISCSCTQLSALKMLDWVFTL